MALVWLLFLSPYAITEIPQAIPPEQASKLAAAGIHTTDELLARAGEKKPRHELARSTKIPERTLEEYVAIADLCRIPGVGPEMARLFRAAHAKNTAELAQQDPKRFFDAIQATNDKLKISQNPPDPKSVAAWIEKAKQLPQVMK